LEINTIILWERENMVEPIKVGRFIAQNRKNLNLTQKELAEKLGVTDRAVSKWENGVSQTKRY
jgi:DNA-binding transcriptional regulator YiaG